MEHQVLTQESAAETLAHAQEPARALALAAALRSGDLLRLQHQVGNRVVSRLVADDAETQRIAQLRQKLDDAIKYEHWREAATMLNAFSASDIDGILKPLNINQKGALYDGALSADGVGADSAAAKATRPFYLDGEIAKNRVSGQWGWVAQYLNAFSEPDLLARLKPFSTGEIQSIHDAAQTTAGVGPDSSVSKLTATALEQRRNAPASAAEKLGQQLYAALSDGINAGDATALRAAKGLASTFYEVQNMSSGEVAVSVNSTAAHATAKRVGISPESLDRVIDLVRPFAPKAKNLYIDYAGRIGTREDLANREQADKIAASGEASSTLGSLMMSYVAARGGNAAEMRNANALGGALEGFASTLPAAGSATAAAHSTVEEPNRTGVDARPREEAPPTRDPPKPPPDEVVVPAQGGGPPAGGGSAAAGTNPAAPAPKPKSKPWEPVPQPLQGGGGGNKKASAEALGDKPSGDIKGFADGPHGELKPIEGTAPQANAGENRSAVAMNRVFGTTYQSPENVAEVKDQLARAKERDGLDANKNPDLLVYGSDGWHVWDVRTMDGSTATADSAMKAAGKKASDGQALRIVINLDGVTNEGSGFANDLREAVRADRRKPAQERETAAVREIVVVKNGAVYRAWQE